MEKVILHMLKISTRFGVAPQSFCENQNSVQNQDQDQDHDIILDFNTRPTFHTWKTQKLMCQLLSDTMQPLNIGGRRIESM